MSKICPNCRKENDKNSSNCIKCNSPLDLTDFIKTKELKKDSVSKIENIFGKGKENEINQEIRDFICLYQEFIDYASTLPVKYDGEFTDQPFDQAVLDQLVGKTVADAKKSGYQFVATRYDEAPAEINCTLTNGYYEYQVIINESWDEYQEHKEKNNYDDLTIKGISLSEMMFSPKAWGI